MCSIGLYTVLGGTHKGSLGMCNEIGFQLPVLLDLFRDRDIKMRDIDLGDNDLMALLSFNLTTKHSGSMAMGSGLIYI